LPQYLLISIFFTEVALFFRWGSECGTVFKHVFSYHFIVFWVKRSLRFRPAAERRFFFILTLAMVLIADLMKAGFSLGYQDFTIHLHDDGCNFYWLFHI